MSLAEQLADYAEAEVRTALRELKARLKARLQSYQDREHLDVVRGAISGLKMALHEIDELLAEYGEDDE